MVREIEAAEVAKHASAQSCWVALYGDVYDVTDFLQDHPGGASIILRLSGRDATDEYDPIHPPGTIEENLKPEAKLGKFKPGPLSQETTKASAKAKDQEEEPEVDIDSLLNLDEIEQVATKKISRKAWAYYYSASDDLYTKSHNNRAYRQILLRPRIFVDCVRCDTSTKLLGLPVGIPLFVSPAAMARLGHPTGENGIAKGIAPFKALQIISNNASQTPEQIVEGCAPGQVFGWQLYVQDKREKSEAMLARINKLPMIKFICLTLDAPVPGKREDDERSQSVSAKLPVTSGAKGGEADDKKFSGGVGKTLFGGTAADLTWDVTLKWLAKHTSLPVVLKGVQTHEDAYLASRCTPQVKGIILSNHGGRALDTAPPAIHTLLEIRKFTPEVFDRIEVWVDGGIKRGTDVVKALCLGAKGVGVGRAALFGLGAGGPQGVSRTFQILKEELETSMRLLGAEKVHQLGRQHVNTRVVENEIFNGLDGRGPSWGEWERAKL